MAPGTRTWADRIERFSTFISRWAGSTTAFISSLIVVVAWAVAGPLFEDNLRAWSGDHCVDTDVVPGVFFCSRPIAREDPALIDIAPSVLALFGVEIPAHMQGKSLFNLVSDE